MVLLYNNSDTINKKALFTYWSLLHFIYGGLMYLFLKYSLKIKSVYNSFIIMIIIHTIYEMKDLKYYLEKNVKLNWTNNNSIINSIGDTISSIIGFYFIIYFETKYNIKYFIFISIIIFIYIIFKDWNFIYKIINELL